MPNTKSANRLTRGDQIVIGLNVYTVGNIQHYWTGDTRVNLTDVSGWTTNRYLPSNQQIELFGKGAK
jgi:hypothetical protein